MTARLVRTNQRGEPLRTVQLHGLFTLRSPLTHIGETLSTQTFLVQEPVVQADASIEEVFVYSGNAWRGQLRDLAAIYMLEHIGNPRLTPDSFHLLFSGGKIGGDQVIDLARARQFRQLIPLVALFGGGVGNQILPGKLRVNNCYPLCQEALPALRDEHQVTARGSSYQGMTFEKSFSRMDDAKNPEHTRFLRALPERREASAPAMPAESEAERVALPGLEAAEVSAAAPVTARPKKVKRDDGPADQMRMTVELLAAGVQLETVVEVLDCTELELGCLTSALHAFSRSPHIGGQANRGHGLVRLEYALLDMDTDERRSFLRVSDGPALLAPAAEQAKARYDTFLREAYDAFLDSQRGELRELLGVAA